MTGGGAVPRPEAWGRVVSVGRGRTTPPTCLKSRCHPSAPKGIQPGQPLAKLWNRPLPPKLRPRWPRGGDTDPWGDWGLSGEGTLWRPFQEGGSV